jgi:hypothetical protein
MNLAITKTRIKMIIDTIIIDNFVSHTEDTKNSKFLSNILFTFQYVD